MTMPGALLARFLDPVDQVTLVVGLPKRDRRAQSRCLLADLPLDVGKCHAAIDLRFALTEKIEVGSVEDVDRGHCAQNLPESTRGEHQKWSRKAVLDKTPPRGKGKTIPFQSQRAPVL